MPEPCRARAARASARTAPESSTCVPVFNFNTWRGLIMGRLVRVCNCKEGQEAQEYESRALESLAMEKEEEAKKAPCCYRAARPRPRARRRSAVPAVSALRTRLPLPVGQGPSRPIRLSAASAQSRGRPLRTRCAPLNAGARGCWLCSTRLTIIATEPYPRSEGHAALPSSCLFNLFSFLALMLTNERRRLSGELKQSLTRFLSGRTKFDYLFIGRSRCH